jgi:virulence factor
MNKRKVAIIGLGNIAQKAYLPVLTALDSVEITAVMSRSEETVRRVCDRYRLPKGCTDLQTLLNTSPEAVFVHAPTEAHGGIVLDCLRNGLHVYVDKPLSYNIRESAAMTEAAEKYGRLLAVGFNRRFAPWYQQAKAWLDEAGGCEFAVAQKHRTRLQSHHAEKTVYDDLIHMLDLLLWLGGESETPTVGRLFGRKDEAGRLLHASGELRWHRAAGVYAMNRSAGSDLEKLELHGAQRSAEVTNLEQAVLSSKTEGARSLSFGSWDNVLYRRGFTGVIDHFLKSLEHPEACTIRADRVMPSHLLAEQLAAQLRD